MVMKDCKPHNRDWWDHTRWRDRLPREIAIHRRIDRGRPQHAGGRTAYRNLVKHKGYRLMMLKRRYRLYQKYYAGGDLFRALRSTFSPWGSSSGVNNKGRPAEQYQDLQQVPEDLIWHVFRSLVKACLFLQYGTSDRNATAPVPDWDPITHRDVHIGNVFIEPNERSDQSPYIVLADYGESFFPLANPAGQPSDNPTWYVLPHDMRGSLRDPPEVCRVKHFTNREEIPINEKADVWKIGAAIWQIITHDRDINNVFREDVLTTGSEGQPKNKKWPVRRGIRDPLHQMAILPVDHIFYPSSIGYSQRLRDLVSGCVEYDPRERWTLRELYRLIKQHLRRHPIRREDLSALVSQMDTDYALGIPYVIRQMASEEEEEKEEEEEE
jgi:serine/threonine protein kinase